MPTLLHAGETLLKHKKHFYFKHFVSLNRPLGLCVYKLHSPYFFGGLGGLKRKKKLITIWNFCLKTVFLKFSIGAIKKTITAKTTMTKTTSTTMYIFIFILLLLLSSTHFKRLSYGIFTELPPRPVQSISCDVHVFICLSSYFPPKIQLYGLDTSERKNIYL